MAPGIRALRRDPPPPFRGTAGEDGQRHALQYAELYRVHHPRVLHLCRLLLRDPDEADDVAQEVFVKLLGAERFDDASMAWGRWLATVALNACRDRRRSGWWKRWREQHVEFVESALRSATRTPEEAAIGGEIRAQVWQSFRALSARQREVFVLRQIEGWSTDEVAAALGLASGTVKRHLFRAVRHLRSSLRGDR